MERSDPNQARLQMIDGVMLTPIVLEALDQQTLTLDDWTCQPVHGGVGGGAGGTFVYRFQGRAIVQNDTTPWSVILKIIHARPDEAPDSIYYWKREAEVYRSGLLDHLPGRLVAAKSYRVDEYPGESCWIWQEDIRDGVGGVWHLEYYEHAARHFGQFNGAYISSGLPIPGQAWLCAGWLRKIVAAADRVVPQIWAMLNHPSLHPAFPSGAEQQFLKLWDERERFLSTLDRLPQTFAHQDPVCRNLFLRRGSDGDYETVAIDWAYAGRAAVGMDIAVPLIINLAFMEVDIADVAELDGRLYQGYLEGLRDAGWNGDSRQVRLGFTASAACKYIEALMLSASFGIFTDPAQHPVTEAMFGHPMHEAIEQAGGIFRYTFRLADEARQLMDDMSYA